jgi:hypothetical protein
MFDVLRIQLQGNLVMMPGACMFRRNDPYSWIKTQSWMIQAPMIDILNQGVVWNLGTFAAEYMVSRTVTRH